METGDHEVFRVSNSGSFSEADPSPRLIPRPEIGQLRRLMLAFNTTFVAAGYGRFVAYRLDVAFGLAPRIPLGLTMVHVYGAARSVGLISIVGDREVPLPSFIADARRLSLRSCDTCGVGDCVVDGAVVDPCWVCLAREEQAAVRTVLGLDSGDQCQR